MGHRHIGAGSGSSWTGPPRGTFEVSSLGERCCTYACLREGVTGLDRPVLVSGVQDRCSHNDVRQDSGLGSDVVWGALVLSLDGLGSKCRAGSSGCLAA